MVVVATSPAVDHDFIDHPGAARRRGETVAWVNLFNNLRLEAEIVFTVHITFTVLIAIAPVRW